MMTLSQTRLTVVDFSKMMSPKERISPYVLAEKRGISARTFDRAAVDDVGSLHSATAFLLLQRDIGIPSNSTDLIIHAHDELFILSRVADQAPNVQQAVKDAIATTQN